MLAWFFKVVRINFSYFQMQFIKRQRKFSHQRDSIARGNPKISEKMKDMPESPIRFAT